MASDNLILEHLRAIRATQDQHTGDLREIKARIGLVESQVGGLNAAYASVSNRLDRIDERLARVERRLDLHEA